MTVFVPSLTYKSEIKELEVKYDKHIEEMKAEYENSAKKEIKSIKEQLNNKYSLDLDKKDLENYKLKIEIANLNINNEKGTTKTNTETT